MRQPGARFRDADVANSNTGVSDESIVYEAKFYEAKFGLIRGLERASAEGSL